MKIVHVLLLLLVMPIWIWAQGSCVSGRFGNGIYFQPANIVLEQNIPYGVAVDYHHLTTQLKFDIAYPDFTVDSLAKRPLIVVIHGGGFYANDKSDFDTFCIQLAQRGYIAATINYRLGWDFGTGTEPQGPCNGSPSELNKAMYRAMQDAHAAFRYLTANASIYGIDTSLTFMVGQSAGAIIALGTAFVQQHEIDTVFPGLSDTLGLLDTSGNAFRNSYSLKGMSSLWGAIFDTSMITTEQIPVLMFQGTADTVVPYHVAPVFNCSSPSRYQTLYGSRAIADRLRHLGVCYELDTVQGAGHGVYQNDYRVEHIACFFRSLICNACTSVEMDSVPATCTMPTGVSTIHEMNFRLYPNPASQTLFFQTGETGKYQVQLYDLLGQPLLQQNFSIDGTMDISGLPKGLYLARITLAGQSKTLKVVVE